MHSYISKRKFVSLALSLQFNFVSRIETATVLNSDEHICLKLMLLARSRADRGEGHARQHDREAGNLWKGSARLGTISFFLSSGFTPSNLMLLHGSK